MILVLSDYITATYKLLRDNGTLYPQPDLIGFINQARNQRDLDTRLVRGVKGFTLTANLSTYNLQTVAVTGSFIRGYDTASLILDVASINVLPMGGVAGGIGIRYPLGRQPYSIVASLVSTSWPSYPKVYARMDAFQVVLAPPPAAAYPSEWDFITVLPDLVNLTDAETMPYPYNTAVPYLAAAIAKENAQRFDEAEAFEALYTKRLNHILMGIHSTSIPSPGFDTPRRYR